MELKTMALEPLINGKAMPRFFTPHSFLSPPSWQIAVLAFPCLRHSGYKEDCSTVGLGWVGWPLSANNSTQEGVLTRSQVKLAGKRTGGRLGGQGGGPYPSAFCLHICSALEKWGMVWEEKEISRSFNSRGWHHLHAVRSDHGLHTAEAAIIVTALVNSLLRRALYFWTTLESGSQFKELQAYGHSGSIPRISNIFVSEWSSCIIHRGGQQ